MVFLNKAEIEKLKKNAEEAFELKELWHEKLEQAELVLISARKSRDLYLTELNALEDKRDWEYEVVKSSSRFYQEVWEEFEDFRNYKNSQIDLLRLKCETEHALMTECFDKAEFAYSNRDKHEASIYRSEGYEHKRRLTELHGEISRCEREIKDAKAEAENERPQPSRVVAGTRIATLLDRLPRAARALVRHRRCGRLALALEPFWLACSEMMGTPHRWRLT